MFFLVFACLFVCLLLLFVLLLIMQHQGCEPKGVNPLHQQFLLLQAAKKLFAHVSTV